MIMIFDKELFIPLELNSNVYDYFIGNIKIRLWKDPLYQVIVTYGEYSIKIELLDSEVVVQN